MVFFDSETEKICEELGYDLILPPASLREHLDSKIVTTRLGNEAGAPSVPNVLTKVEDWAGLQTVAEKARLGDELVVQTPYGDSGKTTFFIASEADWKKHSDDIVGQEIKVMRRINNRPVAVEAVLTRCGTIVGPFMSELIGYKKLTPVRVAGAATRCSRKCSPAKVGVSQRNWSAGWVIGWPRRDTGASSRSTSWSTPTPTRYTSANSTPGSAGRPRSPT